MMSDTPDQPDSEHAPVPIQAGDASYELGDDVVKLSRWPQVIGGLSLIYAILGLSCLGLMSLATMFSEFLMALSPFDTSNIKVPASARYIGLAAQVPVFLLGFYMLFASISLIRRRRAGVRGLKIWAVLRLVMIFVGFLVGLFLAPANIEINRQMTEAMNEWARREGQLQAIREFDEDAAWRNAVMTAGGFAAVSCIYPLFIGFYLSRKKINDEVEQWP